MFVNNVTTNHSPEFWTTTRLVFEHVGTFFLVGQLLLLVCHRLKWTRQLAFIVDLLNVFSVLRAENDHLLWLSIPELEEKCANFVRTMDGVNAVNNA